MDQIRVHDDLEFLGRKLAELAVIVQDYERRIEILEAKDLDMQAQIQILHECIVQLQRR
jgi:hypothetical protein